MSEKQQGLKDLIFSKPFKFWCCSNSDHKLVTWNKKGTHATCDECGETSPTSEKTTSFHEQYSHKKHDYFWETATEYPEGTFTQEELVELVRVQRGLAEKPMRVIKVTTIIEEIEVFK